MLTRREYQQIARALQTSAVLIINREPRVSLQAALILLGEYVATLPPRVKVTVESDVPSASVLGVQLSWPEDDPE